MKISLVDIDSHNFPNLALMKVASFYKKQGHSVDWFMPLFSNPDKVFASKVFTFTRNDILKYCTNSDIIKGGSGYDVKKTLPQEIDEATPDYSIYPQYDFAVGFLSRGCIRSCDFCLVQEKEGYIKQYSDIEKIHQGRNKVVLMDNNFLANEDDFIKEQLEKIIKMNLRIDFNQGLDCRLLEYWQAELLAKLKYCTTGSGRQCYVRFACDSLDMIEPCRSAIRQLLCAGYKGEFFVYVLAKDTDSTLERINYLTDVSNKVVPFVMPFRDIKTGNIAVKKEIKDLARWCNRVWIRKKCSFAEYKRRKK